jgi:hypothetical protein
MGDFCFDQEPVHVAIEKVVLLDNHLACSALQRDKTCSEQLGEYFGQQDHF